MDVAQNWQQQQQQSRHPDLTTTGTTSPSAQQQQPHMRQNLHHLQQLPTTTHHFPSNLRHSPNPHPPPTSENDLSPDSTMMTHLRHQQQHHVGNSPSPYSQDHRPHLQDLQQLTMTMAPSHALSLDDSPSWNSAMTPMSMSMEELAHFYRQQGMAIHPSVEGEELRGQIHPPDCALPHLPSQSSTDLHLHPPQSSEQQQHHPLHPHLQARLQQQHQLYAQELRRQQLQQLHHQQHPLPPVGRRLSGSVGSSPEEGVELDQAEQQEGEGYLQAFGGSSVPRLHPAVQQGYFQPPQQQLHRLHHPHGAHPRYRGEETRSISTGSNHSSGSTSGRPNSRTTINSSEGDMSNNSVNGSSTANANGRREDHLQSRMHIPQRQLE